VKALLDALLLLMVLIWAGNYSLVKWVFSEMPPMAFNALRLLAASAVYVAGWSLSQRLAMGGNGAGRHAHAAASVLSVETRLTRHDWLKLAFLGVVGHCAYQLCFINGLARTTVANSALISGCTPVVIALLSAWRGHERVTRTHWAGALLSLFGLYLVAGRGARISGESLAGDLLILVSVGCWAVYTVFSRGLLRRHSPLIVTSATMVVGTALFVPLATPELTRVAWEHVTPAVWLTIVGSAVLALNGAYLIWYTAVQRLGSARTSVFSNLVPIGAMIVAAVALGERIDTTKWTGAAAVLGGVLLTRLAPRFDVAPVEEPPAET
jgi:drug/metabolite transporter (DMT)-like permease